MIHTKLEIVSAVEEAKQFDLNTAKKAGINLYFFVTMNDFIELFRHFKKAGYIKCKTNHIYVRDSRMFFHFLLNGDLNADVEIRVNEESMQEYFNNLTD